MDHPIDQRFIVFAGNKTGGSQRLEVNFDLEVYQDYWVNINGHNFIYNCVKKEIFTNQEGGTINVVYVLKHTGE